jgi:hypothetical protein
MINTPKPRHALSKIAARMALGAAIALPWLANADGGGRELFIASAIEHADDSVTLPLRRGVSAAGEEIWFVILDTSDGKDAAALGVNQASKLSNARGTAAVMKVRVLTDGTIQFPASVDFSPERRVVPGSAGFPPDVAEPGAVGEPGYSPLIQLPNGVVRNAPQVANRTGKADKVVAIDFAGRTVRFQETHGFAGGKAVRYVSTDASDPVAAALENVTFAPSLNAAPSAGADGTDASRASLAAFVNGQTGADNAQRQGLNSALLDGLDPLNVLRWNPSQGRYSPLWDVHFAQWSAAAVDAGATPRQTTWMGGVARLASKGRITGVGGTPFGPAGIVVDCPIVSSD